MVTKQIEWSLTSKNNKKAGEKDDGDYRVDIFNKWTWWPESESLWTIYRHREWNGFQVLLRKVVLKDYWDDRIFWCKEKHQWRSLIIYY